MAVYSEYKEDGLSLFFNKGDLTHLRSSMKQWGFKDFESLTRFWISVSLLAENKDIAIRRDGQWVEIMPPDYLLDE